MIISIIFNSISLSSLHFHHTLRITLSLSLSLTHTHTHTHTHTLIHSLTHSLTHSLALSNYKLFLELWFWSLSFMFTISQVYPSLLMQPNVTLLCLLRIGHFSRVKTQYLTTNLSIQKKEPHQDLQLLCHNIWCGFRKKTFKLYYTKMIPSHTIFFKFNT